MKAEMINEVAERLGAEVQTVNKNGIDKVAICVREGKVGVNIYAEQIEADTVPEAVDKITEIVDAHRADMQRMGGLTDALNNFESVKSMLRARLYHKDIPYEVKRSAKKYGFDDLIIVPYIDIENDPVNGSASARVNKKMLENWEVTAKEVIDIALENTAERTKISSLMETIQLMLGNTDGFPDMGLPNEFVVTTDGNTFGAAGILSKIDYFKNILPNGFYVLPSSVHEVLVHAATGDENEQEALTKMVQDVNRTTVDPEEKLADKAYAFI